MKRIKYLAVIPAREGSKRLPKKNILNLAGKPLIAWTIKAATDCTYIDLSIVSTNSKKIAETAKEFGANIPFLRPEQLSTDTASSYDVVKHAIDFYKEQGYLLENIILLQPTSPLRSGIDIDQAIEYFEKKKANSVTSVCEMEHSPLWSNTLPADLAMDGFLNPEIIGKRSQDLPTYFRLNGAIYIMKVEAFLKEKTFISSQKSYAHIMKKEHSIDIDNEFDFNLAEQYLELKNI